MGRPSRWRANRVPVRLLHGLTLIALAVTQPETSPDGPDCERTYRTAGSGAAVIACRREYERTRRPATGVLLADAMYRSGDRVRAALLAYSLRTTAARSDALQLLGKIAIPEGRLHEAAERLLDSAQQMHRAENRRSEVAKDALILAGLHGRRDRFTEALYSLDECIVEAQAASDRSVEGLCHLAAARALTLIGYFDEARRELARAEPLLSTDDELAALWLERGNVEQTTLRGRDHATHGDRAIAAFERALGLAARARRTDLVLAIELNLAFSFAELGWFDEADRHHASATALDRDGDYASELAQLAARIAYRRGHLALASAQNARLYETMPPGDDRFEICVIQARIAYAMNNLPAAEQWARRGIEEVERIRAQTSAIELRPWVLASRRAPYELLFTVLAHGNRHEEALLAFDQWQGRTLLDAMSRPVPTASSTVSAAARVLRSLERWLPVAANAPLMSAGGSGATEEALRSIDLLALAVAEGDVWRMIARRGQIRIERIGSYAELADRLDRFQSRPTDRAPAGELGALLVPAELFQDTSTLYVILDVPLAALPVAALRRDGKALIAARPVLRIPRLPTRAATCKAPRITSGATVLADARGDLPASRHEAGEVAKRLKTSARIGSAATSAALFAAGSHSVLHVAVHSDFETGGGVLQLYDRSVSALEISAAKRWPPLVVLSASSTARSSDPELAGSLSAAFLASGSSHVVATLRPVTDTGAHQLTGRFYREGGLADPVRALAAIQAQLAEGDTRDWPHFAIFGHPNCSLRL
jgi:tetratricopeptide (TPR) repeat protein